MKRKKSGVRKKRNWLMFFLALLILVTLFALWFVSDNQVADMFRSVVSPAINSESWHQENLETQDVWGKKEERKLKKQEPKQQNYPSKDINYLENLIKEVSQ